MVRHPLYAERYYHWLVFGSLSAQGVADILIWVIACPPGVSFLDSRGGTPVSSGFEAGPESEFFLN